MSDEPDVPRLNGVFRRAMSPTGRRWLYGVLMALVPILTFYGALTEQEATLWAGMVATVLGLGTAMAHVPAPELDNERTPPDGTGRHRAEPLEGTPPDDR